MSYYMDQFDQAFRISAENKAAAFEALKGWTLLPRTSIKAPS